MNPIYSEFDYNMKSYFSKHKCMCWQEPGSLLSCTHILWEFVVKTIHTCEELNPFQTQYTETFTPWTLVLAMLYVLLSNIF